MNKSKINFNQRFFRSTPENVDQSEMSIDAETGIIKNVVLCQVGPAKGHGVSLEQRFVETVVNTGNEFENGLKMRFGHPQMSSEALGTFVGYCKNLSIDGDKARGDIYLSSVANKSPNLKSQTFEYLLEMAEKHPNDFMLSVVTLGGIYYQYDEEGNEVDLSDEEPNWDETIYYAPEKCTHVDFVDEGAATDGLFSELSLKSNLHAMGPQLTEFLDSNPKFDELFKTNPDKLIKFIETRYGSEGVLKKLSKKLFGMDEEKFDIEGTTDADTAITVVTENSKAGVGDAVTVAETGEPLADGEHNITDGDMAGQTISVTDGAIMGVWMTPEAAAEEGAEGEEASAEELAANEALFASIATAMSTAMAPINERFDAIEKEMGMPAAAAAAPVKKKDKEHGSPAPSENVFKSAVPQAQLDKINKFQDKNK